MVDWAQSTNYLTNYHARVCVYVCACVCLYVRVCVGVGGGGLVGLFEVNILLGS